MHDRLQSSECARYLKAVADPERLRIVQCLQQGPRNVSELAALLDTSLANASHHLAVLRHTGLVCDEKRGKYVLYSLNPAVFRPGPSGEALEVLDFGCCRLDLGGEPSLAERSNHH
jgi:ArsR family transcriptional regulator